MNVRILAKQRCIYTSAQNKLPQTYLQPYINNDISPTGELHI